MKFVCLGAFLLCFAGVNAYAQQGADTAQVLQEAPTTRVIALGHLTSPPSDQLFSSMQQEVRDTVRLYLAGKIDQWYVRKDQNGVVFILNATSVEQAKVLLANLPLVKQHLMAFDLVPVGPLSPLGLLVQEPAAAASEHKLK